VSVPAQIAVLLALTATLFDPVPIDQMTDAEHAVHEAAANIPAEVCARFETANKLSDEDRKTIIEIARKALAPFQPKPEAKPETKAKPKLGDGSKTEVNRAAKPETTTAPKPKPGPEPESKPITPTEPKSEPRSEAKPEPKPETEAKPDGGFKLAAPKEPKPAPKEK
jgi:F-type H+-transporting ATPase subunit alpha